MKEFITHGDDAKPNSPIQKIIEGALGIPVSLETAPTTANSVLSKHGDIGHIGANIYINLSGTVYRVTATAV